MCVCVTLALTTCCLPLCFAPQLTAPPPHRCFLALVDVRPTTMRPCWGRRWLRLVLHWPLARALCLRRLRRQPPGRSCSMWDSQRDGKSQFMSPRASPHFRLCTDRVSGSAGGATSGIHECERSAFHHSLSDHIVHQTVRAGCCGVWGCGAWANGTLPVGQTHPNCLPCCVKRQRGVGGGGVTSRTPSYSALEVVDCRLSACVSILHVCIVWAQKTWRFGCPASPQPIDVQSGS